MLRILIYAGGALLVAVILVVVIGYALPQGHVASGETVVAAAPGDVFARISDVARYPEWRTDVDLVEVLPGTPVRWRERSGGDVITYEVVERRPPERLRVRIADPGLPFGGTWTYELRPEAAATRVVITEHGEVYNPVFRFMSRFVFGHTASITKVLRALEGRR